MEIYDVEISNKERLAKPKRLQLFAIDFAICFMFGVALCCASEWLWPDRGVALLWPGHRLESVLAKVMILVIPASVGTSLYGSSKKFRLTVTEPWQRYQIIVEENLIRTRNFNSYNRMLSKTIMRGKVKTIVEKEMGLLISGRDRLGTFLCGGIWIPKRLADYEYLRRLVSTWKLEESA